MSTGDIIALATFAATVIAGIATLFSPQFQKWWSERDTRSAPITLGNISPSSTSETTLAPGIVIADSKTLEALQEALPSTCIEWLHKQDFGNSFRWRMVEKIETFNWSQTGPEHEFLDAELERMRAALRTATEAFIGLASWNTASLGSDDDIRKIPDQRNADGEYSDELFFRKAHEINDAADEVWEKYRALVRRARLRLALSHVEDEQ